MARYAPGLPIAELRRMTPAETDLVRKNVEGHLDLEEKMRLAYAKGIIGTIARRPM